MTDYTKLFEALRCKVGITEEETKCEKCPYGTGCDDCDVERYCNDAADAIEELNKNWKYCSDMLNLALNVSGLSMTALVKLYETEVQK